MRISNKNIPHPRVLLLFAFIAFIALGMPDGLFGVAWPSMRDTFGQSHKAMGGLLSSSIAGYILSSFFSARISQKLGIGRLLALSCLLTGMTLFGYTIVPSWFWLVSIAIFLGVGAGAIDSSLNTYLAAHYAEKQMQWLHASYGVGVSIGPIIMTTTLSLTGGWYLGYRVVAVGQLLLAVLFLLNMRLWDGANKQTTGERKLNEYATPLKATLRIRNAYISMALFFVYVGLEVTLGHWGYTFLTESRAMAVETAGFWAGSYWLTFTVGRVLAGLLTRRFGVTRLFIGGVIAGSSGALLLLLDPFQGASLAGIALVGFALAPMYPALMSLTAKRVGAEHAANTIGLQVSISGFGGAILPGTMGFFAAGIGVGVLPIFVLVLFVALATLFLTSTRR